MTDDREDWERECSGAMRNVQDAMDHGRQDVAIRAAERVVALVRYGAGVACQRCGGHGSRSYGSTATWRGGAGGASMTDGVCDVCWGSGRSDVTGQNLRMAEQRERELSRESSSRWLAARIGVSLSTMRPHLREVAKRLKPKRADEFRLQRAIEVVAGTLLEMGTEPTTGSHDDD